VADEISPKELAVELDGIDPPLLLDVRTPQERALARIEPSLHIGLDQFLARVEGEIPRDADVVVYCHSGIRSTQVADWMTGNGWRRVRNLTGGVDAWSAVVDPNIPRY
jgi:adenylyltransferase/sulfurtransferase